MKEDMHSKHSEHDHKRFKKVSKQEHDHSHTSIEDIEINSWKKKMIWSLLKS